MSEFEKITQVTGAWDKTHPEPSKNYGIHSMQLRFILKGEKGATQFCFSTCQHLKHVADNLYANHRNLRFNPFHGMGTDIGYHSPTPQYEGQTPMDCDLLPGGKCYYDGTSLGASEFEDEFIAGGDAVVWPMLEKRYRELFEGPQDEGDANQQQSAQNEVQAE